MNGKTVFFPRFVTMIGAYKFFRKWETGFLLSCLQARIPQRLSLFEKTKRTQVHFKGWVFFLPSQGFEKSTDSVLHPKSRVSWDLVPACPQSLSSYPVIMSTKQIQSRRSYRLTGLIHQCPGIQDLVLLFNFPKKTPFRNIRSN